MPPFPKGLRSAHELLPTVSPDDRKLSAKSRTAPRLADVPKTEAGRIEELRAQAGLLRNEIARLVAMPAKEREPHRARLTELRVQYFRLLDEIDRMKRLPSSLEKLLEPQFSQRPADFYGPQRFPNKLLN